MISPTKPPPESLGSVLRMLRAKYRRTQTDLALAGSTAAQYVSIVERGQNPKTGRPPRVSQEVLEGWGRALGESDAERQESTRALLAAAGYAATPSPESTNAIKPAVATEMVDAIRTVVREEVAGALQHPQLEAVYRVQRQEQRIPASDRWPVDEDESYVGESLLKPNLWSVHVRGHCMEPLIADGDRVIVDPDLPAQVGSVVAVYEAGDWMLKRIRRRNGVWLLVPDNPAYDPVEIDPTQARILGVVIRVVKRV